MFRFIAALTFLASTLFTAGCDQQDTGLIWYDEEFAACYTDNDGGKTVEVPCDQQGLIWYDEELSACFIILSNGKPSEVPYDKDPSESSEQDLP